MKADYDDLIINYHEKIEIIEKQDIEINVLNREIERLHSIIKEVREYINNTELGKGTEYYRIQILQILDRCEY